MQTITVTIETPKGSNAKFDYNPQRGSFELKKVLPAGMCFPFDFGLIPGTTGGDGDPLDVLVISEIPSFTGCVMECRLIGCFTAVQKEKKGPLIRNDRFIAIPEVSVMYRGIKELRDLPKGLLQELEAFFVQYNTLAGKKFKPQRHIKAKGAMTLIEAAKSGHATENYLIQLFLPLCDEQGRRFPQKRYTEVRDALADQFGGITVYERSPVSGLWEDEEHRYVGDRMIIFEVMTDDIDHSWWQSYKEKMRRIFRQKELLIRRSMIGRL